jgi:protein-L-isoaspartate(D-aspartate) O-methyltransferase
MNAKTEAARRQMIDQQVRAWNVLDVRVLDTLAAVPREAFVPEAYRRVAFADASIPIGHGQFMLSPALEGRRSRRFAASARSRSAPAAAISPPASHT